MCERRYRQYRGVSWPQRVIIELDEPGYAKKLPYFSRLPLMEIFIVEINDCSQLAAQLSTLAADFQTLKDTMTQATEDLLREVQETKAQNAAVVTAINQLVGVVTPLIAAVASANEALAAAQTELATLQSANTELDQKLATAAGELDTAQAGVQQVLETLPSLPPA